VFLFVAGKWLQVNLQVVFCAVSGFPGNRQLRVISDVLQHDCPKEGNLSSNNDLLF
jgi:hypothetical protein